MNHKSDRVLSLQIAGLQAFYWMIFCPISSYASVYLLVEDFSNQQIGLVMALSNILAVVFQPALGALLDRVTKISLKTVLFLLSVLSLAMLCGLIFLDLGIVWITILYIGIVSLLYTMPPLVNSLTFAFINVGHDVSFGSTRAIGSICFAIFSPLLGLWVKQSSTDILPISCIILYIGFILVILSLPQINRLAVSQNLTERKTEQNTLNTNGFFNRYNGFLLFLLGLAFIFLFHTIINTYLAQIITSLGGQDTELGISLSLAAICELPAFFGFNILVRKFQNRTLLRLSGLFYVLRSIIFLLAVSMWLVYFGQALQGITFGLILPGAVYYVNQIMHEEDKIKGQTFVTGFITLGAIFGSVIGGWLLDFSGIQTMLIFGVAGAVIGGLLVDLSIRKNRPNQNPLENIVLR